MTWVVVKLFYVFIFKFLDTIICIGMDSYVFKSIYKYSAYQARLHLICLLPRNTIKQKKNKSVNTCITEKYSAYQTRLQDLSIV